MPSGSNKQIKVTFIDKTKEAMSVIRHASEANFTDFIETMGEIAMDLSPFLTGHNMASIKSTGQWGNRLVFEFAIFTESGYGAYLELGTTRMAARPYFAPAFQQALSNLKSEGEKIWSGGRNPDWKGP